MADEQGPDQEVKKMSTFKDLKAKLLAIGGDRVLKQPEPYLDILIERGQLFSRKGRKKVRGEIHRCHANVALYYVRHHTLGLGGTCEIVTGYGLYADGCWRPHTWLWDGKLVIEMDSEPEVYFGVMLRPAEAAHFVFVEVMMNLPGWPEVLGGPEGERGAA
jgi:hypothetical protein